MSLVFYKVVHYRNWTYLHTDGDWENRGFYLITHVESLIVYKTEWVGSSNTSGLPLSLIPVYRWGWGEHIGWKPWSTNVKKVGETILEQFCNLFARIYSFPKLSVFFLDYQRLEWFLPSTLAPFWVSCPWEMPNQLQIYSKVAKGFS